MLIRSKPGWELPKRAATDEAVFHDRRRLAKVLAAGPLLLGAAPLLGPTRAFAAEADPSAGLYPAKCNLRYRLDRPVTSEKIATTYNNFYEFGSHKQVASTAQALKIRSWTVTFDGMVEKRQTVDIDTLLKKMPLEERVYRMRCVEAWSIVVGVRDEGAGRFRPALIDGEVCPHGNLP
jgi:sulfoxide reductase catalytic subunit YedY